MKVVFEATLGGAEVLQEIVDVPDDEIEGFDEEAIQSVIEGHWRSWAVSVVMGAWSIVGDA